MLLAPSNEIARGIMVRLLLELDQVRVKLKFFKLSYSSQPKRVCYLLGTNHHFHDLAKRVQMADKTKIFTVEEVRLTLKLSESLGKKKINQFEKWEQFLEIYCKLYPKQSVVRKYTKNNKNNIKNYVFVESKEQGVLAMLLLEWLGNHPTFISKNLKIGDAYDIP